MKPKPRFLLCLIPTNDGLRRDYTPISPEIEKKINVLYPAHKLPAKFLLQRKEIVTDTILGFCDKALPDEPNRPRLTSWSELREHVQQQKWYLKAQAKNAQAVPKTKAVSESQDLFA